MGEAFIDTGVDVGTVVDTTRNTIVNGGNWLTDKLPFLIKAQHGWQTTINFIGDFSDLLNQYFAYKVLVWILAILFVLMLIWLIRRALGR